MLALAPTSVVIQAFESRFTRLGEQDFLLSKDGSEAFPVTSAERIDFIEGYRRAMRRARVLRWLGALSFLPLLILTSRLGKLQLWGDAQLKDLPGWDAFTLTLMWGIPAAGIFQHMITNDVMVVRIMRKVENRFATRLPAALKPRLSKTATIGFILLFAGSAIDIGFRLYFGFEAQTAFEAAHMRALYGFSGDNDPWYAQLTAGLLKLANLSVLVGIGLLWASRQSAKRSSIDASGEQAHKSEPGS